MSIIYLTQTNAADFAIQPLSEKAKQEMIQKNVWTPRCPISLERLRLISFPYYDFSSVKHQDGQLVVLDVVAENMVQILKKLYALKYPIAKARTIENYDGDDDKSMADNNSSAFNCRSIAGTSTVSIHSYGLAIDINPIQNPCITIPNNAVQTGIITIAPTLGVDYINRINIRPGMSETIVDIFAQNGFSVWGGKWNAPIDWQHFQPSRAMAQLLGVMTYNRPLV